MKNFRYSSAQKAEIEAALLADLQQHGPSFSTEIAFRMNLKPHQVAWFLTELFKQSRVEKKETWKYRKTSTRYRRVLRIQWKLPNEQRPFIDDEVVPPTKVESKIGLTDEDHAWMAYWRQRHRERESRRHAFES